MEAQFIDVISSLGSYGGLGAALIYFMVKDYKQSDKQIEAIDKSTAAISAFTNTVNYFNKKI